MLETANNAELIHLFIKAVKRNDFALASRLLPIINSLSDETHVRVSRDIPLLAWESSKYTHPANTQYLFVSGTARSGTTALGNLLNTHTKLAIFTELYSHVFGYHPKMFSPENITVLQRIGLLENPLSPRNHEIFCRLHQNNAHEIIVGDKRPNFLRSAQLTLQNFQNYHFTLIHVRRPIQEVAWSYVQRCRRGTWSSKRDHMRAVQDSNHNNQKVLEIARLRSKRFHLIILDYHLFWNNPENAYRLFESLNLSRDNIDQALVSLLFDKYRGLQSRERILSPEMISEINSCFDYEAENQVLGLID